MGRRHHHVASMLLKGRVSNQKLASLSRRTVPYNAIINMVIIIIMISHHDGGESSSSVHEQQPMFWDMGCIVASVQRLESQALLSVSMSKLNLSNSRHSKKSQGC